MEKKSRAEKENVFKQASLAVKEPTPGLDSLWGIRFRTENEAQDLAYNLAVEEVCKKHALRPFHQISGNFDSSRQYVGKGEHGWDLWRISSHIDPHEARQTIENLFEEIHTRAQEIAEKK